MTAYNHTWNSIRHEWVIEEPLEVSLCSSRDVIGCSLEDLDCISSISSCNDLFLDEFYEEDLYLENPIEAINEEDDIDDNNLGLDLDQEYETVPFKFKSLLLAKSFNFVPVGEISRDQDHFSFPLNKEPFSRSFTNKRLSMEYNSLSDFSIDLEDSEPVYKRPKSSREYSFMKTKIPAVSRS